MTTSFADVVCASVKVHELSSLLSKEADSTGKILWLEVEFTASADRRAEVVASLRAAFGFAYAALLQPAAEGFTTDWSMPTDAPRRAVFIGSRAALANPLLVEKLPLSQRALVNRRASVWVDVGTPKGGSATLPKRKDANLKVYAFEPSTRLDTFMTQMSIAQIDHLSIGTLGADYQVIKSLGARWRDVAELTCGVRVEHSHQATKPAKILSHMANKGFVVVREETPRKEADKHCTFVPLTDWAAGRISPFVPDETLVEVAQALHELQPLTVVPAWSCHDVETSNETRVAMRRAIWQEARRRQSRLDVELAWWGCSAFRFRLGNDLSLPSFVEGRYDPNEFALMNELIQPGATVLDIGGNEGLYSVFMARKAGRSGRVIVFEPSPREQERLVANVRLNGLMNVKLERCALADSAGSAVLKLGEAGHAGLNTLGDFPFEMKQDGDVEVSLLRLDDYAARAELTRLDFIKLDAEGAEQKIIRGGRETLKRFMPVILLEVNHAALTHQGSSTRALCDELLSLGYDLSRFGKTTGKPELIDVLPETLNENIIAMRR